MVAVSLEQKTTLTATLIPNSLAPTKHTRKETANEKESPVSPPRVSQRRGSGVCAIAIVDAIPSQVLSLRASEVVLSRRHNHVTPPLPGSNGSLLSTHAPQTPLSHQKQWPLFVALLSSPDTKPPRKEKQIQERVEEVPITESIRVWCVTTTTTTA